MIHVGAKLPSFSLTATISNDINTAFKTIDSASYKGKWMVLFFWPKDFTFICPTEIVAFDQMHDEFKKRNAALLGASVDSEFVHLAWRTHHKDLNNLSYPMLSDIKRELSNELGILDQNAGVSQRAVFIIDPEQVVRFVMVTDLSVGRNPNEILRILDALQTGELCPVSWKKGEATL